MSGEEEESIEDPEEIDELDVEPNPESLAERLNRLSGSAEETEKKERAEIDQLIAEARQAGRPKVGPLTQLDQLADRMTGPEALEEMRGMLIAAAAERAAMIAARDTLAGTGVPSEPPLDVAALDGPTFDRLVKDVLRGGPDILAAAPTGHNATDWAALVKRS